MKKGKDFDIRLTRIKESINSLEAYIEEEKTSKLVILGYIDGYFKNKNKVTKNDFANIWEKSLEFFGCGDIGADWDCFEITWVFIRTGEYGEY